MKQLTLSSDLVLKSLLGSDTTTEIIREVQARLRKICTPWENDGCSPPGFVRKDGTGMILGIISARLGGFAWPHTPYKHGWGYRAKNPAGSGVCESGIMKVDTGNLVVGEKNVNVEEIKACEEKAKLEAMKFVDEFLVREFKLVLLERVL